MMKPAQLRIGIDIGGTFTDFVVYDPAAGTIRTFKLLSTPTDPAEAVLEGLLRIQADAGPAGLAVAGAVSGWACRRPKSRFTRCRRA